MSDDSTTSGPSKRRLDMLATPEPQHTEEFILEDDAPAKNAESGASAAGAPGESSGAGAGGAADESVEPQTLRERIIAALRTVRDPEIPLNIYDLGLIYQLDVDPAGRAHVRMTLTAPGCPVADYLVREVHSKVLHVPGVSRGRTELVWDPPWTKDRMSEEAKLQLGLM